MFKNVKPIETRSLSFEELSVLVGAKGCKLHKWEKGLNWEKFYKELGNPDADLFLINGKVYVPAEAGLWETLVRENEIGYLKECIDNKKITEDFYFKLFEKRIKEKENILRNCQILNIKDRYSVEDNKLFMVMGENDAWVEVLLPNMERGSILVENIF